MNGEVSTISAVRINPVTINCWFPSSWNRHQVTGGGHDVITAPTLTPQSDEHDKYINVEMRAEWVNEIPMVLGTYWYSVGYRTGIEFDTIPMNTTKDNRCDFDMWYIPQLFSFTICIRTISTGDARGWRAKYVRYDTIYDLESLRLIYLLRNFRYDIQRCWAVPHSSTARTLLPLHSTVVLPLLRPVAIKYPPPPNATRSAVLRTAAVCWWSITTSTLS